MTEENREYPVVELITCAMDDCGKEVGKLFTVLDDGAEFNHYYHCGDCMKAWQKKWTSEHGEEE